jgi:hypothetical protein
MAIQETDCFEKLGVTRSRKRQSLIADEADGQALTELPPLSIRRRTRFGGLALRSGQVTFPLEII